MKMADVAIKKLLEEYSVEIPEGQKNSVRRISKEICSIYGVENDGKHIFKHRQYFNAIAFFIVAESEEDFLILWSEKRNSFFYKKARIPELPYNHIKYEKEQYQKKKDRFYKSKEWRSLRYEVLKEQKGQCQLCGRSRKDGVVIHVDHIVPLSKDWSKRLEKNNLQLLCEDCNLGKSNSDSIDWR